MPARWLCASEQALPPGTAWLTPREREWVARFRFAKRRDDYLLGRWVAKRAVAHALDLPREPTAPVSFARIDVRNKGPGPERGAPEVFVDGRPAPLELSITDRSGWGVCMVGPPGARLGCDLEVVEPRSPAFVRDYFTPAEAARVEAAGDEEARHLLANLLWCAKESALKVLRTGLRRDTRSVEVELAGDALESAPAGWQPLRVLDRPGGAILPGWWGRFGHFLLTMAGEVEAPAPRRLAADPDLARGEPSHAWLAAPRLPAPEGDRAAGR